MASLKQLVERAAKTAKDVNEITRAFVKLKPEDVEQTKKVLLAYLSLEPRTETQDGFGPFSRQYFDILRRGEVSLTKRKRELLGEGLAKIIKTVPLPGAAQSSLVPLEAILELPTKVLPAWVQSLNHLASEWDDDFDTIENRLKRYLNISRTCLLPYDTHYSQILKLLGDGKSIYGAEEFMLELAKEEQLPFWKVRKYFDSLQKVPYGARITINDARKASYKKRKEVNKALYGLFSQPNHTKESLLSMAYLLNRLIRDQKEDMGPLLLANVPILGSIVEKDLAVMQQATDPAVGIISRNKDFLKPYLEVVESVADLSDSTDDERARYVTFSSEIFGDYLLRDGKSKIPIAGVQGKCNDSIATLLDLDEQPRLTSLELLDACSKMLERGQRLNNPGGPLYFETLVESVATSAVVDPEKARAFIQPLFSYRGV